VNYISVNIACCYLAKKTIRITHDRCNPSK